MGAAFDEIAFIATSENRIRVLEVLADRPMTRRELQDELGISQSTASRVLTAFEERELVVRSGGSYKATVVGTFVARAFARLVEQLDAVDELRAIVDGLPLGEGELDITDFVGAAVTMPTAAEPFNVVRPVVEGFRYAGRVQGLTHTVAPEALAASRQAVVDGDQWFEVVLDHELVDAIRADETMRADLLALLGADRATVYIHDDVPYAMGVLDETAQLALVDAAGNPLALVETDSEAVVEWVCSVVDDYREAARELTITDLEMADEA